MVVVGLLLLVIRRVAGTYVVDALRITFTGGPTDHLWRDVAVLAGFLIVAVGLTILVVHRRRRFRIRDLHPILV